MGEWSLIKRLAVILCTVILMALISAPGNVAAGQEADELYGQNSDGSDAASDGYIVRLKDNMLFAAAMTTGQDGSGAYIVVDSIEEAEALPADIVEYIEPNYIVELLDWPPDDPYYQSGQWNLQQTGMGKADELGLKGANVKVAFIDSGIFKAHEDLAEANITGKNFAEDGKAYTADLTGHGTFAAGIVAAKSNNGKGIAGMAPDAQIMAYRAFMGKTTTMAAVVSAIDAAVNDGCDILNMSLGSTSPSSLLEEAIERAEAAGVIMVAAVGNSGSAVLVYPAAYNEVIGVGSVKTGLVRSDFSQYNRSVYVTAPGENITSLGYGGVAEYVSGKGTSYAAPAVAGLAALALGYDSDITEYGIRYLLETTSNDVNNNGYDIYYGYGVIDINSFLTELTRPFSLTYNLSGGMLPEGAKMAYSVKDDTFLLPVPTLPGHIFAGWSTSSDLSGSKIYSVPAGSLGDRTYFATWALQSKFAIDSVMVSGQAAKWNDGGYYQVYLPYGSDLASLTHANISVVTADKTSTAGAVKSQDDISGAEWKITVTSNELAAQDYELRVGIMQLHVKSGQLDQSGAATPSSVDGKTAAVPYFASVSAWFVNGDGQAALPADFACEATVISGGGTVSVDTALHTVTYMPAWEDSGANVVLHVFGSSNGLKTLDYAEVTVAVAEHPQSLSEAVDSVSYDKYKDKKTDIMLTLYGNTVASVGLDGRTLLPAQYSLSEVTSDGTNLLTLPEAVLAPLSLGAHTVHIEFSSGSPSEVVLTVSDSAPLYTVTFIDRKNIYHTIANVREGSTVSLPADPTRDGYDFGGWYNGNVKFTGTSKVMSSLSLDAKWTEQGGSGSIGGGGGGSPAPVQPTFPANDGEIMIPFSQEGAIVTVELSEDELADILAGKKSVLSLDLTEIKGAAAANIDTASMRYIAESGLGVEIIFPQGKIILAGDALKAVLTKANGSKINISVEKVVESSLSPQQRMAVGSAPVFNISISSGATKITTFNDAAITVALPYEHSGAGKAVVFYIKDDGTLERVQSSYDAAEKKVTITINHLSLFAIMSETETWENPFADVRESDWFYKDVEYAVAKGLFNGTSANAFSPNLPVTRGMLVEVLYRLDSLNPDHKTGGTHSMSDVPEGSYYSEALGWAVENELITGYSDGTFRPGESITRQDMAVVLRRYMNYVNADIVLTMEYISFADEDAIAGYAKDAVQTMYKLGVITGVGGERIDPAGSATRVQVAAMLHRFIEKLNLAG